MCVASWWPICLRWPLCPGVIIAFLAVVAAVVTFWEHPPRTVKVIMTFVFLALMSAEVFMMSKDRDAHDRAEHAIREAEQLQRETERLRFESVTAHFENITTQLSQVVLSNSRVLSLGDRARRAEEEHATTQLAAIRQQQDAARKVADDASRILVLTMAPNIISQMDSCLKQWNDEDTTWRHRTPLGRGDPQYLAQIPIMQAKYSSQVRLTMIAARSIQQQLLTLLGESGGYEGIDRAASGQLIRLDELRTAGQYLTRLVRKVEAQNQPKE